MPEINLSNAAGRDAVVNLDTVVEPLKVRWIDDQGRQANPVRFLKSDLSHDIEYLQSAATDAGVELSDLLIDGDPDVDMENVGTILGSTSRVYVNPDNKLIHRAIELEEIRNPDGSLREQRPAQRLEPNVAAEIPLRWSGVYMSKAEVVRRFVLSNKLQLTHINGLTYDFLFEIARDLHERKSMLLLGGGPRGDQPLVLRRGSLPYRGFLEGRIRSECYLLLLHLSNLELKMPKPQEEASNDA